MSVKSDLGPELPCLRRYARALTGSQTLGDAAVRTVLEALLAAPREFDDDSPPREELYRVFHRLWTGLSGLQDGHGLHGGGAIASLSLHARQALLLTTIEGFSVRQAAAILGCTVADVAADIEAARLAITDSLHSRVLIIEDETIIALHIRSILEDLGHELIGIARTRSEAAEMAAANRPELVLADISLADGSSGIGAVKDILDLMNVPVIFITAFPERLLTGERPEPTWLINKPFSPETVTATIGQALLFHREATALGEACSAGLAAAAKAPDPRKHFTSPEALLDNPDLSDAEKQALLAEWDSEIDGRLNAESEGMGISDPMTARKEGQLADEAGRVKTALNAVTDKSVSPD